MSKEAIVSFPRAATPIRISAKAHGKDQDGLFCAHARGDLLISCVCVVALVAVECDGAQKDFMKEDTSRQIGRSSVYLHTTFNKKLIAAFDVSKQESNR